MADCGSLTTFCQADNLRLKIESNRLRFWLRSPPLGSLTITKFTIWTSTSCPWLKHSQVRHFRSILELHVLIPSLTGLSRLNANEETFLLVTAALANLTFMSPLTSSAMKRVKTAETLVKVVKMSPFTTLFAKDQVIVPCVWFKNRRNFQSFLGRDDFGQHGGKCKL